MLRFITVALAVALLACSDGEAQEASGAVAAAPEGATEAAVPAVGEEITTASGLKITHLVIGEGAHPKAANTVKVHYHGTLRDGTVFDSSVDRGTPAEFPLNRVIPCWTEGLQLMKEGGKSVLVCPADIAYGDRGAGQIKPGAALRFDVELIEVQR